MSEPCCDYRDHQGVCACPEHERSKLHPFGTPPVWAPTVCSVCEEVVDGRAIVQHFADAHLRRE